MTDRVRWAELLPHEFVARQTQRSVLYVPLGLCEPHGQVAAFGLDTIKADYLCEEAALRFGGIVAPTIGYHIHETGIALDWLEEVVGSENPRMAGLPPEVVLQTFLYQLRAFANAGFDLIVAISGHNFGQQDLRLVAEEFMRDVAVSVVVRSDPELVEGEFEGDHAGRYEISQLLQLRPDLVDLSLIDHPKTTLGRFALNPDANEATAAFGRDILERSLANLGELLAASLAKTPKLTRSQFTYAQTAKVWKRVEDRRTEWVTVNP